MTNCPNCGSPISGGQRFCGVCSYDLQTAGAPTPAANAPFEDQSNPYAYSQPTNYYDTQPLPEPGGGGGRTILVGVIFVLAICFSFACGVLIGFEVPTLMGVPVSAPTRVPTPRPSGWLDLLGFWIA